MEKMNFSKFPTLYSVRQLNKYLYLYKVLVTAIRYEAMIC